MNSPTIPTDKGEQTIPEITNTLMYGSYEANRNYGLTHQQLLNIGIGNEQMKQRYEKTNLSNKIIKNPSTKTTQ